MTDSRTPPPPAHPGLTGRTKALALAAVVTASAAAGYGWWATTARPPAASAAHPTPALEAHIGQDGSVVLSAVQLRTQGVETAPARATDVVSVEGLMAQAMVPLAASAQVVAPYSGVVTRLLVDEGALVRQGQALARIQSQEVLSAEAELARARTEAATARLQAQRDAALLAEGIIAAARHEQSQARAAAAHSTLQQAQGALARLRPVAGGAAGEYELLAPIAGQVVRRQVVPGQAVAALEAAFVLAEPGQLDLFFSAPLRLRSELHPGLNVRLPDGMLAQVQAVGADADAASQSLRVRARLQAADGTVLPYAAGQQMRVSLQLPAPPEALIVPTSALLPAGAGHVLFVAQTQADTQPAQVRIHAVAVQLLGDSAAGSAVRVLPVADANAATPTLAADMQVVTRGTALLKSMVPMPATPPAL